MRGEKLLAEGVGFEPTERSRFMARLNVAKEYDGIRTDPRFTSLVHRVGLPE
jgi:hypothetical protein